MSAAVPAPTHKPSRAAGLLVLVRKLIDYGKELTGALRQHGTAALGFPPHRFGTSDIALILARITHGLLLAGALETRITASATRLDADPKAPRGAPAQPGPRVPRTAREQADASASNLAAMPTPAQIAAEVHRRPIGAVLADICRDLGILPNHPLWQELEITIIRYSGNYARLMKDILDRLFPLSVLTTAPRTSPPQTPEPAGTGPP